MARRRLQRGSLRKRVGKHRTVWVVQWREDVVENGQVIRRFRKESWDICDFPTRKLAQRELELRLSSINSPDYRPTHKMLFADFAQRWTDTVLPMHKPSSQNSEKVHIGKYIRPYFDTLYLSEISPMQVQRFVAGLTNAPKTVRNIYATFRSMWRQALEWGLVAKKMEGIKMPRLMPVERPTFTIDQMQQIIAAAEEPVKTLFWLAAETGMRIGELIGLRICDVDINNCTVHVRQSVWQGAAGTPKSLSGTRKFGISERLAERLTNQTDGTGDRMSFVFHTCTGQPWDARFIVRDKLQPLLSKLGIPKAGMHAFRHGNATWRLQSGEDVKTLAVRLGHSDPSITLKVYAHSAKNRELSTQMGNILMPNEAKKPAANLQMYVPEGVAASA